MDLGTLIIAIITAIATSVIGVFLVLRKMSMMTDAISHTVLLGIVIAYLIVQDLNSPFLIFGATAIGIVTVYLIELLVKSNKTTEDAAIGVVFPLLFSIAIIIINTKFRNAHLDIDAVLLGKLEIAVFERIKLFGLDIGPKSMYTMLIVAIINISFIIIFFKELKIVSFDSALATVLGFSVFAIHYALMTLISFTAVVAFDAVGSILVIAMMIGPAMTALIFTKDLRKTIIYTVLIGVLNSVVGYTIAFYFDVTISGTIATMTLVTFLGVLILSPNKGVISTIVRRHRQKNHFALMNLVYHLINHDNKKMSHKLTFDSIKDDFRIDANYLNKLINRGLKMNLINYENDILKITNEGMTHFKTFCQANNLGLLSG